MRGEGITAVGLKEVLVGAAGAGHEDGHWRRWPTRVGPRGAIRRIAREPGASWGSAHLGAPGPGSPGGEDAERIKECEKEVRQLRRASAILKERVGLSIAAECGRPSR